MLSRWAAQIGPVWSYLLGVAGISLLLLLVVFARDGLRSAKAAAERRRRERCRHNGHVKDPAHKRDRCLYCEEKLTADELHEWNGSCTCAVCGARRDTGHVWDGCVCRLCGKKSGVYAPGHDWDGCVCRVCGQIKALDQEGHDWEGCVCRRCGWAQIRTGPGHDWDACTCRVCGRKRLLQHDFVRGTCRACKTDRYKMFRMSQGLCDHDWDGCICRNCGHNRPDYTGHDPDDRCVCRKCGGLMPADHPCHSLGAGCKCEKCGAHMPLEHACHDWDGCVCRLCGAVRPPEDAAHDWDGCVCRRCHTENHLWGGWEQGDEVFEMDEYGNYDFRGYRSVRTCCKCGETESDLIF